MYSKKIYQIHKDFILNQGKEGKNTIKHIAELFEKEFGFFVHVQVVQRIIRQQKTLERDMLIEAYKDRAAFTAQFMQSITEENIERVFNIMKEYTEPHCSMNEKKMGLEASKVLNTLIQGQLELSMGKTEAKQDSQAILDKLLLKISGGKVLENNAIANPKAEPNPFILTEANIIDVDDAGDPFEDEEAVEEAEEEDGGASYKVWKTADQDYYPIHVKYDLNPKKQ